MTNKNNKGVARRNNKVKNRSSVNPQANTKKNPEPIPTSAQVASIIASWSAPVPPPSLLAEYEAIVPGSAARIMETAHAQSAAVLTLQTDQNIHRIESEKQFLNGNERRGNIGQYFALLIAILIILLSGLLVLKHYPTQGATLGGSVLVEGGIVWFLGGRAPRIDQSKG